MRRILINYARAGAAEKRGGEQQRVSLSAVDGWTPVSRHEDILALDTALSKLATLDPRSARVVELRCFAGLQEDEVAMVLGVYAPDIVVKNAIDKRKNVLRLGLPDALDLMVICAEAGLSLDSSLKRVAKEMALSCAEIADEFGLASVEIGFLPDRVMALRNLVKRTALPGIRGLVNTLIQSERYGTPLAQSLRVLSAEYRNERLMKAEEKAARLPAIMTVPMILFVLPPLFVVLIGPGALKIIDSLKGLKIPH